MPVTTTIRKHTADGDGSSGQAFTVPFTIDEEEHLYVYEGSTLKELTTNYTITQEGIKIDGTTQQCVVTWVGSTVAPVRGTATVYTFIRITPRTQPVDGVTVTKGDQFERGLGRLALQTQESMFATLEVYDADGALIHNLGTPVADADMANYLYAQARFSTTGYLPPPISGVDNGKYLHLQESGKVIWKDPFLLAAPGAADKVPYVGGDGSISWVAKPTEHPATPNVPSFLCVNSGGSAIEWRDISDLPPTDTPKIGSGIISQEGGTVAWEEVKDIPPLPNIKSAASHKYILNLWSTTESTESTTSVSITKATNIKKGDPTYNYGAHASAVITASSSGSHRNSMFEVDVSSNNFDVNKIVKAELKLRINGADNSTDEHTLCLGRLKQTWSEGTGTGSATGDGATWETYDGSNAWPGGDGALNDVDYDMHVYPAYIKGRADSAWTVGTFKTFDVTHLLIDAIENRSGVLNMYMFSKSNPSATVWINWASDDNGTTAYRPTLEVTLASDSGRMEKWAAVAWGHERIAADDSMWFNLKDKIVDEDGNTPNDVSQPHVARQIHRQINHNLEMNNLKGVSFVTANDVDRTNSGSATVFSEVYYHTAIAPNDPHALNPGKTARLSVMQSDWLFATSTATLDGYSGNIDVAYVLWTDTPESATNAERGAACG